ncbi:alpha/beta fold hydrolase [Nocardioides sp. Kera G14]|uniref:alpha/beta fold hydrolase n=1 Tax=Nocardioides sp. Kera G14 TaxID=2884264 RepID=UPI001D0F80D2|nr:alpha/beta hydrolase [Nocardioides sp. Kera G14]UDY24597.1 alpha/beta fold hydrolase [Nocardioides sp. Kera G14]
MTELTYDNTSRFVGLPSGKVHYNQVGEGHPLIMLHGSGPGATGWSNFGPNIAELSERFACYAVDMPGWGESSPVPGDERDHVQTALEFMDELGLEKAAFVGNSMGGLTTINFGVRHPERQSHLITMGAGAVGVKLFGFGDGPSEGLKTLVRGYREPSIETMLDLVDVMAFDAGENRERLARERYESLAAHPEHATNFLSGSGKRDWPSEEQLAGIRSPALLIHGRDDRVVSYESGLKLVALIPNSRLVLLNRCGHWAQVEHAAEFNRLVADFVTNN